MSASRLPEGGAIDRGRPLAFTFDGRPYVGVEGDSIASALLANNVRIVGRSFKYRRPRGIWGAWTEEPNAVVEVTRDGRTTPNLRATTERLANEIAIRSINASPNAAESRDALLDRFSAVLPAGFYYKTFLWPHWETFEPTVRRMAGLGRIDPDNRPPADNPIFNAHCDLLVVGAGPAGLAAANAAAKRGAVVFLVDDHAEIGGQLLHRGGTIDGADGRIWAEDARARVLASGGRVLTSATAFGIYDHNLVQVWERRAPIPDALWRVRPKRIVVAAGAIERPLVLPDNDRPGVMSADAALVYLRRYAVRVGERIAIAANNDSAYPVAEALADAGAEIEIFDARTETPPTSLRVTRAEVEGVLGRNGVEAVKFSRAERAFDTLLLSGGWTPTVHLYAQARGKLRYDDALAALVPSTEVEGVAVAGAANGAFTLDAALSEGHAAGGGEGPGAQCAARPLPHHARLAEARRAGSPLDRLPERRDAEGRRARGPRGLRLGRTSQALHDARHGDGSGQDVQRQRPRGDGGLHRPRDRRSGNDDLSPALCPRADGRRRGAATRRAHQPVEAPAARSRASRRWRATPRIWRLAEARVVWSARPRSCDPARSLRAPAKRSGSSTARRSARSR